VIRLKGIAMYKYRESKPHPDEQGSILAYRNFFHLYFSNADLDCETIAHGFGISTSYFHRVMTGKRPFLYSYINRLVQHFQIDHARLYWSVEHFNDPQRYFDPSFENIVIFINCFFDNYTELQAAGELDSFNRMLSSIGKRSCQKLAREQFTAVRSRFSFAESALEKAPKTRAEL